MRCLYLCNFFTTLKIIIMITSNIYPGGELDVGKKNLPVKKPALSPLKAALVTWFGSKVRFKENFSLYNMIVTLVMSNRVCFVNQQLEEVYNEVRRKINVREGWQKKLLDHLLNCTCSFEKDSKGIPHLHFSVYVPCFENELNPMFCPSRYALNKKVRKFLLVFAGCLEQVLTGTSGSFRLNLACSENPIFRFENGKVMNWLEAGYMPSKRGLRSWYRAEAYVGKNGTLKKAAIEEGNRYVNSSIRKILVHEIISDDYWEFIRTFNFLEKCGFRLIYLNVRGRCVRSKFGFVPRAETGVVPALLCEGVKRLFLGSMDYSVQRRALTSELGMLLFPRLQDILSCPEKTGRKFTRSLNRLSLVSNLLHPDLWKEIEEIKEVIFNQ